jgi:hypothetical protein
VAGTSDGTASDLTFHVTVPCNTTADTGIGSACTITTMADAVSPGAVKEGKRAIWELGQMRLFDGGADGSISTADNTLFAVEGIFIP